MNTRPPIGSYVKVRFGGQGEPGVVINHDNSNDYHVLVLLEKDKKKGDGPEVYHVYWLEYYRAGVAKMFL